MNDIFIPYSQFIIVYIDDILVFSKNIQDHFNHLNLFKKLIIQNGFLGHNIEKGKIIPINRSIEFASKFPDEILEKQQLQRFLGSLNHISIYYKNLASDTAILYERLKKNPKP
uniref:Reverse transcriptase domain-containing protein n=1 Tax=Kalanchoe fedtschenkoi TaxID=63787 RepID=A0A7N0TD12_KALFE